MKKFLSFVLVLGVALCLGFGLSACGNESASDAPIVNTEFAEFSRAAVDIITDVNSLIISKANADNADDVQALSMKYTDAFDGDGAGSVYEDALDLVTYYIEQGLGLPLVCGDIGCEHFGLTEFYGVVFFIEGHDLTLRTVKSGNAYFTYAYNADSNMYLVNELTYNGGGDYEVTCYETTAWGYSYVKFNSDFNGFGYSEYEGKREAYSIDLDGASYVSTDETVVNEIKSVCENDISSSDFDKQSSGVIGAVSEHSVNPSQFHESFNKYINWGGMVYSEKGFIVDSETGYLLGYETDDPSVTAIKIPEQYESICGFYINAPNVKTVYIPKTVKYLKTNKANLQFMQTGTDGPVEDRTIYVDCPVEFFSFSCSYYFHGNEAEGTALNIENFIVEDGSPLFSEKDGSLYSKDGSVLLHLADNPNLKDLKLTCDKISESALSNMEHTAYTSISGLDSIEYSGNMVCFYQGNTSKVDILTKILTGLLYSTGSALPMVELETVTVNDLCDDEEGLVLFPIPAGRVEQGYYDYKKISIGKLILSGDFSCVQVDDCVNIGDGVVLYSEPIVREIIISSANPNCTVSGVRSTEELTVTRDHGEGEMQIDYLRLKKLIIEEGVQTFYCPEMSDQGQTMEVHLPSTIKKFFGHTTASVIYYINMNPLEYEYRELCNEILIEGLPSRESDEWKNNVVFKTDEEEERKLSDFERYTINTERRTLSVQGYYGTDEILVIPKSIYGFTVTWFESYASTDTPLDASQIKEVHLSNSLEFFDVDYNWRLDKIVFDGTVEEFEALRPSTTLFEEGITDTVVCEDGTIVADAESAGTTDAVVYTFFEGACEWSAYETEEGEPTDKFVVINLTDFKVVSESNGEYVLLGNINGIDINAQMISAPGEIRYYEHELSISGTDYIIRIDFDDSGDFMHLNFILINKSDIEQGYTDCSFENQTQSK